ncbi:SprT family zinc-dependent metalloprotease [Muricomes intestini]|uniref:M48 family metallopeptidase n=1 Tax=Muricomes intestini TaxID=1796634 RepID=UPI002FDD9C92
MITEYRMKNNEQEILIQVKRSSRKSIGLEVKQTGEVLARIPLGLSDRELKGFIQNHQKWIINKLAMIRQQSMNNTTVAAPPLQELTAKEIKNIKDKIVGRVQYYGKIMGVTWGRITIRNQKTRWGSCSAKGNLNFNYQLFYLQPELLDYVVVHELAHRRHMNHSPEFWREVECYYPNYKECRKRLKMVRMAE